MFSTADTVVAIATPTGRGGLGVVRLSGLDAVRIAGTLTNRTTALRARRATLARIVEPAGSGVVQSVDEVVVTWFAAPHSYTGEDVIEISAHGSPVLLGRIVELAIHAGARLAEPGEFTFRGYLNGRMDLVQAEAVADLVAAVTPAQMRAAMDQLDGTITKTIQRADAELFDLIAKCEASLDFPDEGFHFIQHGHIEAALNDIASHLDDLLATASRGRLIREGRIVVLAGRPNTGKSSLFNALLGCGRAIVTDIPGTTRDMLTERVDLLGVPVTLVDTAGVQDSLDPIEIEGIRRAREARAVAEMVLLVLDGSAALTKIDRALLAETQPLPRVIAVHKSDRSLMWNLKDELWAADAVLTSVITGDGLDELRRRIVAEAAGGDDRRDTPALTNLRHIELVRAARAAVARARAALDDGATEELLLVDLHEARHRLEEVTGHRGAEDVLRHIFSSFCIGK